MKAQVVIVGYQIALVIIVGTIIKTIYLELDLKGVLYGGFITVATSIVMACRINQAVSKVREGSQRGSLYIYLGVIERLFIAIALFSMGFMWLKFGPVSMVIGLISGQVGFMIGGFRVKD
ncbi:MAG: hypothetical protein A6F70_01990 [Cycloclasticus sp. symbiont of Bathymodiolus heckerae]|nr:MAG: hypothetical protein A6F70_01990 [Cycloclasticus sp. symbiont of Bathymodiolus heckerae]